MFSAISFLDNPQIPLSSPTVLDHNANMTLTKDKPKCNYHAVSVGRKTGVFSTWTLCNKQVNKFPGATHEGFESLDDAVVWLNSHSIDRADIRVFDKSGDDMVLDDYVKRIKSASLVVDLPPLNACSPCHQPQIKNAIIAYIAFSMQKGTAEKIKSVVTAHFVIEDIIAAKEDLWRAGDTEIIGERKRRRDGSLKTEKYSHVDDIVSAIYLLDAADKMPDIVLSATDLGKIPRSHPEELNDISLADRLNTIEEQMTSLRQIVDGNVSSNHSLKRQILELQMKPSVSFANVAASNVTQSQQLRVPISEMSADVQRPTVQSTQHQTSGGAGGVRPKDNQGHQRTPQQHVTHGQSAGVTPKASGSLLQSDVFSSVSANLDGFQEPSHVIRDRRRQDNRRKRVVQGSKSGGRIRGAPSHRDVFVYRLLPETTTDLLTKHIEDEGISVHNIDCISNPNAKYKSFKVQINLADNDKMFNPDMWPEGIRVRKFIPPRIGDNA